VNSVFECLTAASPVICRVLLANLYFRIAMGGRHIDLKRTTAHPNVMMAASRSFLPGRTIVQGACGELRVIHVVIARRTSGYPHSGSPERTCLMPRRAVRPRCPVPSTMASLGYCNEYHRPV
jgi:hypothetical protein